MRRHYLILGGARSGKSRHAESLAEAHRGECIYVATAEEGDEEMRGRISEHRARRGVRWRTIEEPVRLAEMLERECRADRFVLVDCLTLWMSNLMLRGKPVRPAVERLSGLLPAIEGTLALVSNEVGLGIVPDSDLGRRFRDEAGFAHQRLAAVCDEVILMVAGLPLTIKG
jgi:adenosylcobinamide kinase/adenosylcobinamide-phosphate guanylyltransferase